MEVLRHVFISFNFEKDLAQLAIKTPMVSSDQYAINNVGKTSLTNRTKHSSGCLGSEETALPLAGRSIQNLIMLLYNSIATTSFS